MWRWIMAEYKTQCINGTLYAYIDTPFWNAEKIRGEHKRNYIGKIVDGNLVPNKKYLLQQQLAEQQTAVRPGPVPATECSRLFYGATYLFDKICEQIGITADLNACFGDAGDQIRAIAYSRKGSRCTASRNGVIRTGSPVGRNYLLRESAKCSATFQKNISSITSADRRNVDPKMNTLPLTQHPFLPVPS